MLLVQSRTKPHDRALARRLRARHGRRPRPRVLERGREPGRSERGGGASRAPPGRPVRVPPASKHDEEGRHKDRAGWRPDAMVDACPSAATKSDCAGSPATPRRLASRSTGARRPNHGDRRSGGRGGKSVTVGGALFEGVLVVATSTVSFDALESGIGPAKAFGFGLLSIARVSDEPTRRLRSVAAPARRRRLDLPLHGEGSHRASRLRDRAARQERPRPGPRRGAVCADAGARLDDHTRGGARPCGRVVAPSFGAGRTARASTRRGSGETRRSHHLEAQAIAWASKKKHAEVVRRMYTMRFPEGLPDGLSLEQVRGHEGARVRDAYAAMARETGVAWSGRSYKQADWGAADPVNRALSAANASLYGLCHGAIVAIGLQSRARVRPRRQAALVRLRHRRSLQARCDGAGRVPRGARGRRAPSSRAFGRTAAISFIRRACSSASSRTFNACSALFPRRRGSSSTAGRRKPRRASARGPRRVSARHRGRCGTATVRHRRVGKTSRRAMEPASEGPSLAKTTPSESARGDAYEDDVEWPMAASDDEVPF